MNEQGLKYYRVISVGELIKQGDVWAGLSMTPADVCAGEKLNSSSSSPLLRPVQVDEWIDYAKQKPTEADLRPFGSIQVIRNDGVFVYYSCDLKQEHLWPVDGSSRVTHWRRITPPQPIVKRVKVREHIGSSGHEVIPLPDGSLKVGCVTIPAADFDEIVRQRAETMGK